MSASVDMINRTVGGYRCSQRIATGGFGTIYKAEKSAGGKKKAIAVKIMNKDLARSKQAISAFNKEYKLCAKLKHPGILNYLDFGSHEGTPYMLMEYFDSVDLKAGIFQSPPFPVKPNLESIFVHIAEALEYIHDKGIVHRDVKPENILVNAAGDVRLIDFSIAVSGLTTWLPFLQKVQGSPSYMSPEQIQKRRLTAASDMYSFGALIFEILGGRPPFVGGDQNEVLNMQLKSTPTPLGSLNSNITQGLDKLVTQMLAKAPEKRPRDMAAFVRQFKRVGLYRHA